MPTGKVQYHWKFYGIKNTEMSFRYGCIMTGTRCVFFFYIIYIFLTFCIFFFSYSDALMEECVRMMQQSLRTAPSTKKRAKSVYSQRNLGTIKERKKEKQQETEVTSEQTIMRILRMRYVLLFCYGD